MKSHTLPKSMPEKDYVKECFDEAKKNRFDLAYTLLDQKKITPTTVDNSASGLSLLHYAITHNNVDAVKKLIELGVPVNSTQKTHLHLAAKNGYTECVRLLLENKADVNALDSELLSTPLHYAVKGCHVEVTNLLLIAGADVNYLDYHGSIPIHYLADIHQPAKYDQVRIITRALLAAGVDLTITKQSHTGKIEDIRGYFREPPYIVANEVARYARTHLQPNLLAKFEALSVEVKSLREQVRDLQREKALAASPSNPRLKF